MKTDPIERTAAYRKVVKEVEKKAWARLAADGLTPDMFGVCHAFWPCKQEILLEEHGIRWRTPLELNPDSLFD